MPGRSAGWPASAGLVRSPRKDVVVVALHTAIAIILTVAWVFPVYWMVNSAFIPTAVLEGFTPQFFPTDPTLSNRDGGKDGR